jgi:hypothetical protein
MLYSCYMETNPPPKTPPGPVNRGYKATSIQLPPDLLDWAKAHPEGLSGLCRRLLAAERDREQRATRRP